MPVFVRRQVPLEVERVREDCDVDTFVGLRRALAGDWLVHGTASRPLLVRDALFRELYEPFDDEARVLLEGN